MAQMNMIQALNSAMDVMMARDPSVVVMGEDVGYFGGVFRVTDGLQRKYGEHRVLDSPISEGGIVATAIGMAVNGLKPVAEIQFADYIYPAVDQIASELARIRYRSAGDFSAPVVIRAPCGGGIRGGQTHSQSPEAIFTHICGVKVVMPSNPYDAKGLLIAAIEDDDPIIFFEPKRIYNGPFDGDPNKPAVPWSTHAKGNVPEGHYKVPIGKCDIVRPGEQVTIVTYGTMVYVCEAAAKKLDIDAEIIDVRTMSPLDIDPICSSVKKTGRCVVAHEATRFSGFGAELSASIQEECFWYLEAPIQRVAGWDTPYPHAFEWEYFPGQARVALALRAAMGEGERRHEPLRFQDAGSRRRHGFRGSRRLAREARRSGAGRPGHVRSHDRKGRGGNARAGHGPHPFHPGSSPATWWPWAPSSWCSTPTPPPPPRVTRPPRRRRRRRRPSR